jgi:hypothetical protein
VAVHERVGKSGLSIKATTSCYHQHKALNAGDVPLPTRTTAKLKGGRGCVVPDADVAAEGDDNDPLRWVHNAEKVHLFDDSLLRVGTRAIVW